MKEIIYQSGCPPKGTVFVKTREKSQFKFRFVPSAFLLGGVFGILLLFSPLIFMEARYRIGLLSKKQLNEEQKIGFAEIIHASDIGLLQPADTEFSLVIPKIGLNSRVLPNVNSDDKDEYHQVLKKGVAHAAGSYLPGQNGTIYIFGHSTDYIWNIPQFKAVFYLLKELEEGDEIDIFYQEKRYIYRVSDKKTVPASNLYYLKPKSGKEEVILQTCWPPGTTWKRLLVFAEPRY